MGLGDSPCGVGLCGLDVKPTQVVVTRTPPAALAFDGPSKNFVLESNGTYRAAHPVDARVFTILRTALGSLRSAASVGQRVGALNYIDPTTIHSFVVDAVNSALKAMVAGQLISIEQITVDIRQRGRVFFAVDYSNLVTSRRSRFNAQ